MRVRPEVLPLGSNPHTLKKAFPRGVSNKGKKRFLTLIADRSDWYQGRKRLPARGPRRTSHVRNLSSPHSLRRWSQPDELHSGRDAKVGAGPDCILPDSCHQSGQLTCPIEEHVLDTNAGKQLSYS